MLSVYLAGLISTDKPASLLWRRDAFRILGEKANVLCPMRGKERLVETSTDGGITDPSLTAKDIILRDFCDVRIADVLLCCLDDFGSDRPLVGTLMELAWAWDYRKPVVAFAATTLMRNHPFVQEAVSHYAPDLDGACDILIRHYLR